MSWRTIENSDYTSFQQNMGEGYYVYLYAGPDNDESADAIFLHEDRGLALKMYKDIQKALGIARKLWGLDTGGDDGKS